jgi:hypothetical protein
MTAAPCQYGDTYHLSGSALMDTGWIFRIFVSVYYRQISIYKYIDLQCIVGHKLLTSVTSALEVAMDQ